GVPDIYQGNEIWDFSLVDPDNRRPVDYTKRKELLHSLGQTTPEELLDSWRDGRLKLLITERLLKFRRENPALFRYGSYAWLKVTGELADCCIAFARQFEGNSIVILAPRLTSRVGFPPIGQAWRDTAVELPNECGTLGNLFTKDAVRPDHSSILLQ